MNVRSKVLFIIAKNLETTQMLSMRNGSVTYKMGYYSAIKVEVLVPASTWMTHLECILLNQRHKRVTLIGNIRIGKSIERESRLMVARQLTGARELLSVVDSFWDNETFPNLFW